MTKAGPKIVVRLTIEGLVAGETVNPENLDPEPLNFEP